MKKKQVVAELQGMTLAELAAKRKSLSEELMKLRFRKATGQLEQSHRVRSARRDLARVATVYAQKRSTAKASSVVAPK